MPRARLTRTELPLDPSAADAIRALADEPGLVALVGDWAGGGAVIASRPLRTAGDPFAALDEQFAVDGAGDGGVGGGWLGWIGVEAARRLESLPPGPPRPVAFPEAALNFHDHVLRLDASGRWWFEALETADRADAIAERRDRLAAALAAGPLAPAPDAGVEVLTPGTGGHELAVEDCVEAIRAGELFQANVCLRWDARLRGRPADAFAAAVERLEPARAALCTGPYGALLSLSPELFLERRGRRVRSAPIKGTAPSGSGEALAASAKDRAENVMIVDLVRNDLGRVCEYGTVTVESLAEPREMAGVAHLVSEVAGTLREDVGDGELVRASFPPGSVTGAPKVQALKAIARLESSGREAFTGAIGFASPVAGLELNVAIRTLHAAPDGTAWLGTGGGVTARSTPHGELEECVTKAAPIAAALGGRLAAMPPPRAGIREVPRALHRAGPQRPDPAKGIFTTLLVAGGRLHDLELHLDRLAASARELYGVDLPADLRTNLGRLGAADVRARVHVRPDGTVRVTTKPLVLDPAAPPARLVPFVLPGGLGAHKWADRRLLDDLATRAGPGGVPLLLDGDGEVLEASYAAVLVVEDGRVVGGPQDHRRLPSTSRARLGDAVSEEPLDLDRLRRADRIVLTSAIRGPHVAVLDGDRAPAAA